MTANAKVKPALLQRCTYVCVRHFKAVQCNREPTDRQYKPTGRVPRLGWSKPQIEIVNEDLAHLGSQTLDHRSFALMTTEMVLGHVSLILSVEVSRVTRNNPDGYRSLVLCGVAYTDTSIADGSRLYHLGFLNDRLFSPSALVLVLLPRPFLSLAVKFFLRYSLDHSNLHRPRLDPSNLCRYYLTFILPDGSRSLIPTAWTNLDMNLTQARQTSRPDERPSTSAALGSLSYLLPPRKIVDSLLRKIDSQEQAIRIPSKEERARATPTRPLARSGKVAPETDPLGEAQPQHAKNDHRPTLQTDQSDRLSKNSGGQP